ncbi:MAG TPA: hypothetical protein VN924_06245 [Bryobacteraceae bacterium]|jgi:hypothetical protein|nr:hypothetical protein [Bryobacteraceae bacterium]
MAGLRAILRALRRAVGRDLAGSFKANNLLFLGLLGRSAEALFVLLGLLLLFPLSSDPLGKIPSARLALWPLSRWQRLGLRLASLALSPVVWIGMLILLKTKRAGMALAFFGLALGMQGALALGRYLVKRDPHWDLLSGIPQLPGRLGGLVRKNVRETLSLLDPYAAALLSLAAGAYRIFGAHPDPMAFTIVALLVAMAMSTSAQSLFGLDLDSGVTRYRLLPVSGWEILLAKDIAFLTVLLVLLLPLDPWPGMTFGLVALAFGHHASVLLELPQQRWRFASGNLPFGAMQTAAAMAFGFEEHQRGFSILALAAVGYLASVYYYGWRWERE